MILLNVTHPAAGGNPIIVIIGSVSIDYLINPIIIGSLIILFFGVVLNILISWSCPQFIATHWFQGKEYFPEKLLFCLNFGLIQTLKRSGRFSFNQTGANNVSSISISEAYKILNLDMNKKVTKEDVNKAYIKIQKKIHPDISPETSRLSSIVNEAKDIVLNDIS